MSSVRVVHIPFTEQGTCFCTGAPCRRGRLRFRLIPVVLHECLCLGNESKCSEEFRKHKPPMKGIAYVGYHCYSVWCTTSSPPSDTSAAHAQVDSSMARFALSNGTLDNQSASHMHQPFMNFKQRFPSRKCSTHSVISRSRNSNATALNHSQNKTTVPH